MTNDLMTTFSSLSPQSSAPCPHDLFSDVCTGLLSLGQGVRFRANGWSMYPTICDGEMINVEPVLPSQVRHGDIILYRSPRGITAHRVIHIQREMEPHGQAPSPIQPPMWGDIPVKSWRIPPRPRPCSPATGANSIVGSHGPSFLLTTRGDSLRADDSPVMSDQILGKVFSVERNGRTVALYGIRAIMLQKTRLFLFRLKQYVVSMLSKYRGFLFGGYLPAK